MEADAYEPAMTTWRGDAGFTDLLDRRDVPKYDLRVEVLGTLDEVSSALGVARAQSAQQATRELLLEIQRDLCYMMSEVAGHSSNGARDQIDATRTAWLEEQLNALQRQAPWAKGFVVPGDSLVGAYLQLARAITRRAERQVARLAHDDDLTNPLLLAYLNRLAYVLYALARVEEQSSGVAEPTMARETK